MSDTDPPILFTKYSDKVSFKRFRLTKESVV